MKKLFVLIAVMIVFASHSEASSPTDYFRTVQNGDWSALATWESSPDNSNWFAATLIPNSSANTISIIAHTITVSTNQDMDQVLIYPGSVIEHNAGTLTVNDGAGDDIQVLSGGIFQLKVNPGPVFSGAATMRISAAGTLMLSVSGLTGAGAGVNATNYVYGHQSILEYTLSLAFSTSGVTYFPNVSPDTIPVFRTTNNIGIVGASASTTFNGTFEANGNITFANSGNKIFRNGIDGTGNIDGSGSGKFIINGKTAVFGGSGVLTVPAVAGMDIGNGTSCNVYMSSGKTVNNNITLLNNTWFYLLGSSLTMNGTISGGSVNAHLVTSGLGTLIMNTIGATPVGFPVGATAATFNPVYIYNGGGLNYAVRVEQGINPAIAVPVNAVNRTWFVTPSGGTPGTVNVNFFYAAGEANPGFNYAANLELGQFTGAWNVIQTGLVPAGSYQVPAIISTLAEDIEAPLVLGNLGAILAADAPVTINYFKGVKQNGAHNLQWKLTCNSSPVVTMVLERSNNAMNYEAVFSEQATDIQCRQPFKFIDSNPAAGTNYYRLKLTDINGNISYSAVLQLINIIKGIELVEIAPNPVVNNFFHLQVRSQDPQKLKLIIIDIQGRVVLVKTVSVHAGLNNIPVYSTGLTAGSYRLFGETGDGKTGVLGLVVQ